MLELPKDPTCGWQSLAWPVDERGSVLQARQSGVGKPACTAAHEGAPANQELVRYLGPFISFFIVPFCPNSPIVWREAGGYMSSLVQVPKCDEDGTCMMFMQDDGSNIQAMQPESERACTGGNKHDVGQCSSL